MDTFIFNLNKNQKHRKLKSDKSIFCDSIYGPNAARFGCEISMKKLGIWAGINEFYDKGLKILPINNIDITFDLLDTEVYKIIIE